MSACRLGCYDQLTFVAAPQLSPDGRHVAFTVMRVVEDKDRRHRDIDHWLGTGAERPAAAR